MGVRVAVIDQAETLRPDAIIFVSEAMPWVAMPSDIPQFDRTYAYREVISPDRAERMDRLLAQSKALHQGVTKSSPG